MALHVVSTPAIRTSAAMPSTMPSSTGFPSTSVVSSSLSRSSPGLLAPLLELDQEVIEQPLGPALAPLGVVGELEHVAHPAGEGVGQVGGDTEDPGDDPDRDLLGVVGGGIGVPVVGEPVEQSAAELAGQRHVAVDPRVREPGQQQPPGPRVQRRVRRNRRQAVLEVGPVEVGVGVLVLVAGDDRHLERAEVRDVVGDGGDVVVAGGQPAALAAVGVGDRAAPAQLVPDAERVA